RRRLLGELTLEAAVHPAPEDPADGLGRPVVEAKREAGKRTRRAAVRLGKVTLVEEMREGTAEIDEGPRGHATLDDRRLRRAGRASQGRHDEAFGRRIRAEDPSARNRERLLPELPRLETDGLRPDRLLEGNLYGTPHGATAPDAE